MNNKKYYLNPNTYKNRQVDYEDKNVLQIKHWFLFYIFNILYKNTKFSFQKNHIILILDSLFEYFIIYHFYKFVLFYGFLKSLLIFSLINFIKLIIIIIYLLIDYFSFFSLIPILELKFVSSLLGIEQVILSRPQLYAFDVSILFK